MALINFQIEVDTSPDAPSPVTLDAGIVEDLSPFDRLQFTAMDQSGNPVPVYVNLAESLVALVKFQLAPIFTPNVQSDGAGGFQVVVTLEGDGGNSPPVNPP